MGRPGHQHRGPFGLDWGKSPADARSVLASKVEFIEETTYGEAPYHTIDQRYKGSFGGMETAEILLRFHRAEFFYMVVTLGTASARSAALVWDAAVAKMTGAWGPPERLHQPPALGSRLAIHDNVPLDDKKEAVLPLFWNENTRQSEPAIWRLRDLMIKTSLWDPFAGWRFRKNGVRVQIFVHQDHLADGSRGVMKPMWIYVKDDRFARWKAEVTESRIVEPRDY